MDDSWKLEQAGPDRFLVIKRALKLACHNSACSSYGQTMQATIGKGLTDADEDGIVDFCPVCGAWSLGTPRAIKTEA